tara:strand:- start:264 stop:836 length:573 start_codon:yes stop_codon:yes gene_type:complete
MLDTDLIDAGTAYTQGWLKLIEPVPQGLHLLEYILHPTVVHQLVNYCYATDLWETVFNTVNKPIQNRQKICWQTDSIIEVAHTILDNCTPQINRIFDIDAEFNGLDLWRDTAGYTISKHTDNPIFNASLQVYLQNLPELYTSFQYNEKIIQTNPEPNHGYLSDNTVGIPHWMDNSVPENFVRYSLHATWS